MPLSIDVVLVVYNRYDLTASCLKHLAAQSREHRVILVDNGSTDDTRARLREEWPQHTLVTIDQNQALSASCNLGVNKGTTRDLLETLRQHGLLDRDDVRKTYRLGPRLARLGMAALGQLDLSALAHPYLRELAEQVRFLESEVTDLRRRLSDSPAQTRGLELRLADTQRSLSALMTSLKTIRRSR